MDKKRLLAQRNNEKKHKPPFVVAASNYQRRVKKRWRLPRGLHSATRQMHRGKTIMPTPGYGSPKAVFGLQRSGVKAVVVNTAAELLRVNVKSEAAVLASGLGGRKRIVLLTLAVEKKIPVLFVKDVAAKVSLLQSVVKERAQMSTLKKKHKQDAQSDQKLKSEKKAKEASDAAKSPKGAEFSTATESASAGATHGEQGSDGRAKADDPKKKRPSY